MPDYLRFKKVSDMMVDLVSLLEGSADPRRIQWIRENLENAEYEIALSGLAYELTQPGKLPSRAEAEAFTNIAKWFSVDPGSLLAEAADDHQR